MIFILNEHFMNGTVTLNTHTFGIEANSFEVAKNKLLLLPTFEIAKVTVTTDTDKEFKYYKDGLFGEMYNEQLEMIG